jgi:phage gp36-like protein
MPYATQQDMQDRFSIEELIQLTDREQTGSFNAEVFTQAQIDGDAEITPYLRPMYVLPFDVVPTNLVRLACDIYRYYLYSDLVPEFVENRYKRALATLEMVKAGKLDLNPAHDNDPAPEPQIHVSKPEPIFTPDRLRNF